LSQHSTEGLDLDTLAVRSGIERSQFNEHSEALYLTSSFVFDSAAQAAARFSGEEEGNVYARFTNPTVTAMQQRLAALEGAEACVATASGMAAIMSTVMALLSAGDHIVASRVACSVPRSSSLATFCRASVLKPPSCRPPTWMPTALR
jgi:O-succinylhomoserine sulfhydrylase